jgi:hypothetical protein
MSDAIIMFIENFEGADNLESNFGLIISFFDLEYLLLFFQKNIEGIHFNLASGPSLYGCKNIPLKKNNIDKYVHELLILDMYMWQKMLEITPSPPKGNFFHQRLRVTWVKDMKIPFNTDNINCAFKKRKSNDLKYLLTIKDR